MGSAYRKYTLHCLTSLLFCTGCQPQPKSGIAQLPIAKPTVSNTQIGDIDKTKALPPLPPITKAPLISEDLGLRIMESISHTAWSKSYFCTESSPALLKYLERLPLTEKEALLKEIKKSPEKTPSFPGAVLPLSYSSPYDSYKYIYHIHYPLCPEKARSVVINLKDSSDLSLDISANDRWVIEIESRKNLNFQLLAEGDLIHFISELRQLYSEIASLPIYLTGQNEEATAALYLANNYCHLFQGIAISEMNSGLGMANLDHVPIALFRPLPTAAKFETFNPLLQRLKQRGNLNISEKSQHINDAISFLENASAKSDPNYFQKSFEDYQFSTVTPWLRVISKKEELDPANIEVEILQEQICISHHNVEQIELLPQKMAAYCNAEWIIFDQQAYRIDYTKEKQRIGLHTESTNTVIKADQPGGLINFFRNEPVYIVYEEMEEDPELQNTIEAFTKKISTLDFKGLPKTEVHLPCIPLKQYKADQQQEDHRVIFIGKPSSSKRLFQQDSEFVSNLEVPVLCQSLCCPPRKSNSPLKLAFILAANDSQGMQLLSDHYDNILSLHEKSDWIVWQQTEGAYVHPNEIVFDSQWSTQRTPYGGIEIGHIDHTVWQTYMKKILQDRYPRCAMILEQDLDEYCLPEKNLSHSSLTRFIPNYSYIKLVLDASTIHTIGNRLLEMYPEATLIHLENLTAKHYITQQRYFPENLLTDNQFIEVIVRGDCLDFFSDKELNTISYSFLPHSLQELAIETILRKPHTFSKEIQHLAQTQNQLGESTHG